MAGVSVIVPVFNSERYLSECVESILNQSKAPYEVILIDDGSTDSSGAICDRFAELYDCIKCIHQPNGGAGRARNTGMEKAAGDYLLFVDSDDYLDRDLLAELDQGKDTDLLFFQFTSFSDGVAVRVRQPLRRLAEDPLNFNLFYRKTAGKTGGCPEDVDTVSAYCWRVMIRREFVIEQKIRFEEDIRIGEDRIFLFHLLLSAGSVACREDVFGYYYRLHGTDSLSGSQDLLSYKEWLFGQFVSLDSAEQDVCRKNPRLSSEDILSVRLMRAGRLRVAVPYNEFAFNPDGAPEKMDEYRKYGLFSFAYRWKSFLMTRPLPGFKELIKFICVKYRMYRLLAKLYRRRR